MSPGYGIRKEESEDQRGRVAAVLSPGFSTQESSAWEKFASKYQVVSFQRRPNSEVGIAKLEDKTYFFKQRPLPILVEEMKAANVMRRIGFTCPKNIDFELDQSKGILVQEYIEDIWSKNIRRAIESGDIAQLRACFRFAFEASSSHLELMRSPGMNDRFFGARVQPGGRMEERYHSAQFSLGRQSSTYEQMQKYRFCIDGVTYQETLGELIEQTRKVCSAESLRPMWLSHGDFVEANVYQTGDPSRPWGLIDLEASGLNWAMSDVVIPLVAMAYMFDYTLPKYAPDADHGHNYSDRPPCDVSVAEGMITIAGVDRLFTSQERKLAIQCFNEEITGPLTKQIQSCAGEMTHSLDEQLKALFFMRLFGAHDITQWTPNDQARALGLTIKLCATPMDTPARPTLENFEELL